MRIYGDIAAWFADAETGRFLEASTNALRLFGYSRDEFLRLTPNDLVVPEEQLQLQARVEKAKKQWGLGNWWTCRRKDGRTFKMQCRYHMQDYEGRLCFFVMVVNTDRNATLQYGCPDDPSASDGFQRAAAS